MSSVRCCAETLTMRADCGLSEAGMRAKMLRELLSTVDVTFGEYNDSGSRDIPCPKSPGPGGSSSQPGAQLFPASALSSCAIGLTDLSPPVTSDDEFVGQIRENLQQCFCIPVQVMVKRITDYEHGYTNNDG